jgi:glutamate-1-semialdehyde 2,1-aminomutase
VVAYNDAGAVRSLFAEMPGRIAAVIVEPVAGNMGVVPPAPGFLETLRETTRADGALLVFDEVMTGWRVHPGGAQGLTGIVPDLTCLGKVLGGGLPAAAYGGRADLMGRVAPSGPVYQAGTLSGNPVAMAAGVATLHAIRSEGAWERADAAADRIARALRDAAAEAGVPVTVNRAGAMLTPFFTEGPVTDYASARRSDPSRYAAFYHALLGAGVWVPPSAFEAAFTCAAHGDGELARVEEGVRSAMRALA